MIPAIFSHLFEKMRIGSAHRKGLGQIFEGDDETAGKRTADLADLTDIDNRSAVDPPELIGVQFLG